MAAEQSLLNRSNALEVIDGILRDPARAMYSSRRTRYGDIADLEIDQALAETELEYSETANWIAHNEMAYWEQFFRRAERKFRFAITAYAWQLGDPVPVTRKELAGVFARSKTYMDTAAELNTLSDRFIVEIHKSIRPTK